MPSEARPASLPTAHAVVLGALHGPAELLPVSSSAHVALPPRRRGGRSAQLPGEGRRAGGAARPPGTLAALLALAPPPRPVFAVLTPTPAALAGFLLEDPIEQRLGGTAATAAGLL